MIETTETNDIERQKEDLKKMLLQFIQSIGRKKPADHKIEQTIDFIINAAFGKPGEQSQARDFVEVRTSVRSER